MLLLVALGFIQLLPVIGKDSNENASKKDDTDKGILTSNPFLDATHFWPLEVLRSGIFSMDFVTGHSAIVLQGGELVKDEKFQEVISTEKKGSYIIAGDFKETCFSNPDSCIMGGMTISFWLKLNDTNINKTQDAYIISSGGQSKKSRGFAFLYFHGRYVACLSTRRAQWKMYVPKIEPNIWNNIVFVWKKGETLSYYLNGSFVEETYSKPAYRPSVNYTILTIGRPNNAINVEFMYPLRMCALALWDRPLKKDQIEKAYDNIKKFHEQPDLKKKRRSKIIKEFASKRRLNKIRRHVIHL
ncbi:adhesion G-protein coupled receptor D1 isoform X4 [Hydra vulgaris]|uniref:Adhesion G-protein coupled receptor D1 isoform X4 n=2 Tax=Hydra vulgaris TaxID=6087 RepID=A0ABM4BYC8_HYDVU